MAGETYNILNNIFSGQTPLKRTNPKAGESEYYYVVPGQKDWTSLNELKTVDVPSASTPNPYLQPQTTSFEQPTQVTQDNLYNDYPTLRDDKRDFFKSTVESVVKAIPPTFESNNILTQSLGAARDLGENYINMVNANLKSSADMTSQGTTSDNYYHCLGNYNAASRGDYGDKTAEIIGNARENFDYLKNIVKNGKMIANLDDQNDRTVNLDSRNMAQSGQYNSAWEACEKYRPKQYDPNERLYYYRKY